MIEVSELRKSYGEKGRSIIAVDGLSFRIRPGTVFGLLGPNGAGKTTTIRLMTTLSDPSGGACSVAGFDVTRDPASIKERIGVVPQENNLDRELSAYENLLIYGLLHRVAGLRKKISEVLSVVDLDESRERVVQDFSGGMKRRLLLARALLTDPEVLFLDEPTIGLDPQIRRHFWNVIRKIGMDGRTVVMTTHYIEEAEALCDMVGIMSKGKMVAFDTVKGLKKLVGEYVVDTITEDGRFEQFMCCDRREADSVASGLQGRLTIRRSSLEDVFVKLTGAKI